MAVPKRRVSKTRVKQRKAGQKTNSVSVSTCPECGGFKQPHRACPNKGCGYYRGRQVKMVEAD